ncbi:serine/threonine-protein kinase [Streptomyces sp. NPDC101225]|uniref:serine/threonine-protein kinase n=1 Tax=Streptomyces sp. NPDC101225 TaxID=3366135 RepID=UPI003812F060
MIPTDESGMRGLTGRTVDGRYVLRDWLGGGGFGAVYRSEQYILGNPVRQVACKLSRRTGITEATAADLFADVLLLAEAMGTMADTEARRHLVHVYDGGLARDLGGRAFLVMEYVQGSTLAAEFARLQRVPARLMVKWARQICLALRGLHGLVPPLLHRDLKPDNVLLGTDRSVRLIDFGLAARMLDGGLVPGTAGTIQYMAPETAAGASVPASDLYSLGLLMYEGLTGRHAYDHLVPPLSLPRRAHGEWLQEQKLKASPVPPSALNNSVSPELDAVVLRCLEVRPGHRFRGAAEVMAALEALPGTGQAAASARRAPAPGTRELAEARRARREGSAAQAVSLLQPLAEDGRTERDLLPSVLAELAEALEQQGTYDAAAAHWAKAHDLVRAGARMADGTARADLARRAERAFRQAGNRFQADHFARLSGGEQGRR